MSNSGQNPLSAALFVLLTICITQPTSSLLQQKYGLTTGLKSNALVAHPILRSNTEKFLELRSVHGSNSCITPGHCNLFFANNRNHYSRSDMLEDDSPIFIDALKREMEGSNSQNASPREVYQNAHFMASFITRSCQYQT